MGVDTRAQRQSVVFLPTPGGGVNQSDRQTVAWIYGGIVVTENLVGDWYQTTVTFPHPYDSSVTSYSAWLHEDNAPDVYLSNEAGGALGFGADSDGSIVASIYHDTGATPANTTLKFQGGVVGAWSQTGNDLNIADVTDPVITAMSPTRVAFMDTGNDDLRVYDFDGTDWTQTGNDLNIADVSFLAMCGLSSTRIAWYDYSTQDLRTYDFDGSDWSQTGNDLNLSSSTSVRLTKLSSSRVALFDTVSQELRVYDFDGTDWTDASITLEVPGSVSGVASQCPISGLSSDSVVLFQYPSNELRTYRIDGSSWTLAASSVIAENLLPSITALGAGLVVGVDYDDSNFYVYTNTGGGWSKVGTSLNLAGRGSVAALSSARAAFIDGDNDDLRTYDLSVTWTDIDTETATANGEWEELSLDVATDADTYDGYRVLVDSSEEYYCFRAMAIQTGFANVNGSTFRIPTDASVFLNAYENNSWQDPGNAKESRVTGSSKTLTAKEAGLVVADPSANAITLTMPAPAETKGLTYRIENRHYGYGLMSNGDCEAGPPNTDGGNETSAENMSPSQSSDEAHGGTYSYKVTDTTGAGGQLYLHDSGSDLHGLTAGETYTFTAWLFTPTTGGVAVGEASVWAYDVTNSATLASQSISDAGGSVDTWTRCSITFTVPTGCSEVYFGFDVDAAVGANEFFYFDDCSIYRHYDVTVSGAIESRASVTLSSEGDYVELVSDGDKYVMKSWYAHGENEDGEWEIRDGIQTCWDTVSATTSSISNNNIGTYGWTFYYGSVAVTWAKAFAVAPTVVSAPWNTAGVLAESTGVRDVTTTGCNLYIKDNENASHKAAYIAIGTAS